MKTINTLNTLNTLGHLTLRYAPLGLVQATTNRLDADGLWVDTGRITLTQHSEVEVLWSERRGQSLRARSLRAVVSHVDERGTQLRFPRCAD